MTEYIQSSPYFLRLVRNAFLGFAAFMLAASFFIPAPLGTPADIGHVPNPVKSAWFLLWLQELVSYGTITIYPVLGLGLAYLLLPFWPAKQEISGAAWRFGGKYPVSLLTLAVFFGILALTVIAMFFRAANWAFVF